MPVTMPAGPFAIRGRLMRGPGQPAEGAVVVDGGKVVAIDSPVVPSRLPGRCLDAAFVAPGFVDVQVNGGFGFEVGSNPAALRALARRLPETGVTSFLPTVISAAEGAYAAAFAAFRAATAGAASATGAARMPGMHLEGPLLAPGRAGAHDRAPIEAATAALLESLVDPAMVRLITLAPERPGALALIARLAARGVTVALGHTDATFAEFKAGVDAGARMATHLFNAMSPFHHREPGAPGAALLDDRLTAMLIADGVHLHPAVLQLAVRAKPVHSVALVTDAIAGAGLPPGPSLLAGQPVIVDSTSARLPGDGRLAGSTLTMDQAVRNTVSFTGVTPATAVYWASEIPVRVLGLPRGGRLTVGGDADIVLLDEDLRVQATFVGGEQAHPREAAG